MATSTDYRLIWFQHLHKVAGSSIVQLAMANGERLYPQHSNGNPLDVDGELIRLWELDATALTGFVDRCEKEGLTFVATEWGGPDFKVLASDPRVILITYLRDPLQRFLSNFYYSYYKGHSDRRSPEDYVDSMGTHTMFNYYCRIFSRHHDNPEPIGPEHFELAISTLALFDCCAVLKENDPFSGIRELLGWSEGEVAVNPTTLDVYSMARLLARGHIHQLRRRLTLPRKAPDEDFLRFFEEGNQWDIRLYHEAKLKVSC